MSAEARSGALAQERAHLAVQLWQAERQAEDLERNRQILRIRLREIDAELTGLRQAQTAPNPAPPPA